MTNNVKRDEAYKTFMRICENLPYNRNRLYAEIYLENTKTKIYIPIRDNLVDKASKAKGFYEELANSAEL